MSEYLHGAYGLHDESGLVVAASCGNLPVYIGLAPIHKLADYSGKVNVPIVLRSGRQARNDIGYSDDWDKFSLGEAEYLHFLGTEPVGPIAIINALDPDVHRDAEKSTAAVTFINGKGTLVDELAIFNTITLAAPNNDINISAVLGKDDKSINIVDASGALSGSVNVEYYRVDPSAVKASDITVAISEGVPMVYQTCGTIPTILAAPGWSHDTAVNNALKNAAQEINGHFNAFVYSDIECSEVHTIDDTIAKKTSELRTAAIEVPCWPMSTDGTHYFHLSALSVHRAMLVDRTHNDLPYETASNKEILITGLVVYDSEKERYVPISFDNKEANRLNSKGIRTAVFWNGCWRLWGSHTGAYDYYSENIPEEIFDCGVRMANYLGNDFSLKYGTIVDKPMHRTLKDRIINDVQEDLDAIVNEGGLLFAKITFEASENTESDMVSGEFSFSTGYTTTPAARAIKNTFKYTTTGLTVLTKGSDS